MLVLLVDEAAGVRLRLRERITQDGGTDVVVREAHDATEAFDIAASSAVDVIVLDVHVREGSGLDALTRLRERAPRAVILVLTNEATDLHRRECLRHGADHFFDKAREFERAVELILTPSEKRGSRP